MKYKDLIINIIYLLILSISFNLVIFKTINFITIIYILLSNISLAALIKLISDIPKSPIIKKLINLIPLLFINIIFIAQTIHYCFYACFFSFYSLTKSGQIFAFMPAILKIIYSNIFKVSLFVVLMIIFIIITLKTKYTTNKSKTILEIILVITLPLVFIGIVNIDKKDIYSSYNLTHHLNNNTINIRTFGLIPGQTIDAIRFYKPVEPKILKKENNQKFYSDKDYNITNINFDKKTNDNSIKSLNNYFKNVEPTNKNEYTGIFKDKNLIFITAESFDFNIISKESTPTLYKMKEEGLYFTNHYTPIYYASTSDGEYTNFTGLLPKEGIWSYIESKNNYYPYTYGNIFKKSNYKTYAYHDGEYNFFDRDKVIPNLGFEKYKACGKNLNINCKNWPESDEEMIKASLNDYKDSKFMTYYISVSGHLSHSFRLNDMAKKHENKTKNLNYSEAVKAYISGNIDLDKALEYLTNNLEKENKLKDTVIVIVPDHFPYGLSRKELKEIKNYNNDFNLHKTGLIIYNSETPSKKINKLSSNIDVLPTLLNMFGYEYDSRILIGKDIMSNNENEVIFNDQSFITKDGYYNNKNKKTNLNKQILNTKIIEVNNKYNASNLIIEKNYYKYLFK